MAPIIVEISEDCNLYCPSICKGFSTLCYSPQFLVGQGSCHRGPVSDNSDKPELLEASNHRVCEDLALLLLDVMYG